MAIELITPLNYRGVSITKNEVAFESMKRREYSFYCCEDKDNDSENSKTGICSDWQLIRGQDRKDVLSIDEIIEGPMGL